MRKRSDEIIGKIIEKFEKSVDENGYNFFKGVEMKISYKGYETRIRHDEEYGLYWGRLDNEDKNVIFSDSKIEKVALKFIKEIKKR